MISKKKRNIYFTKILEKTHDKPRYVSDTAEMFAKISLCKKYDVSDFDSIANRLYYRKDCCEFDMNAILRLMYLYNDSNNMSDELKEDIKFHILDFDYWFHKNNTNPGRHLFWTENHVLQYLTAEYLAAQLYPNEHFRMREVKGKDIVPLILKKLEKYIILKAKTGYCEWNSNIYADENFHALFNLYDFTKDDALKKKCKALLDVMILQLGLLSYQGHYGATHGRGDYLRVTSTKNDSTADMVKLLWDVGDYVYEIGRVSGLAYATSNYKVPDIINKIIFDDSKAIETKEQQSFNVEDGPSLGFGYEDEEDLVYYWHNMGYTHRNILKNNIKMEKKYHLNINCWTYIEYRNMLRCEKKGIDPPVNRSENYLSRVNTLTYKTPDYMLSCAQDFRKGERGYQQHIWQATLAGGVMVYTSNPGNVVRPNYWAGNAVMPRAVQYKNALICIYNINKSCYYEFTHAHFPRNEFDEVCEVGKWIFGRKQDGYIGLYSQKGFYWSTEKEYKDIELRCDEKKNIWICQMGNSEENESFEKFVADLLCADFDFDDLSVTYNSNLIGKMEFDYSDELKVNGEKISIKDYKRIKNEYVSSDYLSGKYFINYHNEKMIIDFFDI